MAAIVYANSSVLAVIQSGFIASTHYIVQPNGPIRLTIEGTFYDLRSSETIYSEQIVIYVIDKPQ